MGMILSDSYPYYEKYKGILVENTEIKLHLRTAQEKMKQEKEEYGTLSTLYFNGIARNKEQERKIIQLKEQIRRIDGTNSRLSLELQDYYSRAFTKTKCKCEKDGR